MILPLVMGRKSQKSYQNKYIWEAIYTDICPFCQTDNSQQQGSTAKNKYKSKTKQKTLLCMKLLNSDLTGAKKKKNLGKVEYF